MKFGAASSAAKGLLIDLDGTLADTLPALRGVYAQFVSDHGAVPHESEFNRLNGIPLARAIRLLRAEHGLEGSPLELEGDYLERVESACRNASPNPGARELLQSAASAGYRTAVVTSGEREAASAWLARCELKGFVSAIVGGRDVDEGKPSPAPYLLALDRIGVRADDSIAVEDSRIGAQSAVAAGLATYVLVQGRAPGDESWSGVSGYIEHLSDVAKLL